MMRLTLLATCALVALGGTAHATLTSVVASTTSPAAVPGTLTAINLVGITPPSNSTVTGSGYNIVFNFQAGQGVVQGTTPQLHAVPVAGTTSTNMPTYLTGGFGSTQTTNIASSGNYISTGIGNVVINFTAAQTALTLLWGSIDAYNTLEFLNGANVIDTLTGTQVAALFAGGNPNGGQGFGGSAYVTATESSATPFTSVEFISTQNSFEFAGAAASTSGFTPVPEPISLTLFGSALAMAGLAGARRRRGTL